tara:strand:+ start:308 stop:1459 length:1152 start_codon:yes stop_codon:yes gene_type:complete
MGVFYIDGSVSGAFAGSGSFASPWTKDSGEGLLEAAQTAIIAAGVGATGDDIVLKAGGLKLSAPLTRTTDTSQLKPLVIRPLTMDGTQRIDIDMNYQKLWDTDNVQEGVHWYFCDFHKFGKTHSYSINGDQWSIYWHCSFSGSDAEDGEHKGVLYTANNSVIIGCRFVNDLRVNGLWWRGGGGSLFKQNYLEIDYSSFAVYTYGAQFVENICIINGGGVNIQKGAILPIQGGLIIRNTFIGKNANAADNGSGVFISDQYEQNTILNNYFHNCYRSIYLTGTDANSCQVIAGNYEFGTNNTNGYPNSTNTALMINNNQSLSASGLLDPYGSPADYRPNDLLIGKGYDSRSFSLGGLNTGSLPTIGALGNSSATVFGQYNPFGKG